MSEFLTRYSSRRGAGDMGGGFSADAASIDGSAHLLLEIAGLLHSGRLDGDVGTMARAPRSHPEVGAKVLEFARFADDQYQDLVLLLTALSTKLRATAHDYVQVDQQVQADLDRILTWGRYVAPEDR
ncbi:MAG: hypothetical protein ACRDTE_00805 [Pseudonocardiaceae bacterium]